MQTNAINNKDKAAFEKYLRDTWNWQRSKGLQQGCYPSTLKPSLIYKKLFQTLPVSPSRRNLLHQLDITFLTNALSFEVTFRFKADQKTYTITNVMSEKEAKDIAIGHLAKDGIWGVRNIFFVKSKLSSGDIAVSLVKL